MNPWLPPVDGYRHLAEVVDWNRCRDGCDVRRACRPGELPILLGGDHCLGIGSITAVARYCRERGKKLRVLWLDAHADFNTHEVTPSGQHPRHAGRLPVRRRARRVDHAGRQRAGDWRRQIRQIGIRSVDAGEKRLVKEHGLDIYDMRYIDEIGMKRAMEEALEGIDANTHVHVSFDVDFLDPAIAPGVGTTVPGGPNYREAQLVMEMIADAGRLGSIDIVELNPAFDEHNKTAHPGGGPGREPVRQIDADARRGLNHGWQTVPT